MKITNIKIYGLEDSFKASKYPHSTDISKLNTEYTPTIATLAKTDLGTGHDNFLNGIVVQFDLTATLKFWPQLQRYHFIDFVSSQSTMHCITKFDIKKQCNPYVSPKTIKIIEDLVKQYNDNPTDENYLKVLYNIPSGFELTARLTTNYRQLKTIFHQRHSHKLVEWKMFCEVIKSLPQSHLITTIK